MKNGKIIVKVSDTTAFHTPPFYLLFTIIMFFADAVCSQNIERKVIIENGQAYFTTIDSEFQLATLHVVPVDKPLREAKTYALPAGRNSNLPVIPFSWDIIGKELLVINFMNNAQNNRRNAIKRIPLHALKEWNDKLSISDVVMQSTEIMPYTWFEPYAYVTEKSTTLDQFFFDILETSDSSFALAISNNGELSIWEYANHNWKKGEESKLKVDDFFSLFSYKQQLYLITSDGTVHSVKNNNLIKQPVRATTKKLADGILVIDKTKGSVLFIERVKLDRNKPLTELIKNSAVGIF